MTIVMQCLMALLLCLPGAAYTATQGAKDPGVILISIDGYRHDYTAMFHPPTLEKVESRAAHSKLIPPFPSKTFPSHLSMITGLYPEKHGIVAGRFYDPTRKETYQLSDRSTVRDGSWYQGKTLWAAVNESGKKTADYFWPGGTAKIGGNSLPTFHFFYDHNEAINKRVEQVIKWLRMPPAERPALITVYFHQVDSAGNRYGTKSVNLKKAILEIDKQLDALISAVKRTGLPINFIVVSDHGMKEMHSKKVVPLYRYANLSRFRVIRDETYVMLHSKDAKLVEETFARLKKNAEFYYVFKRSSIPSRFRVRKSARMGDILILSKGEHTLLTKPDDRVLPAVHGFLPSEVPEMAGIFYAWGPRIKRGSTVSAFENIHIYPFVLRLLNLPIPKNIDGDENVLGHLIQE